MWSWQDYHQLTEMPEMPPELQAKVDAAMAEKQQQIDEVNAELRKARLDTLGLLALWLWPGSLGPAANGKGEAPGEGRSR